MHEALSPPVRNALGEEGDARFRRGGESGFRCRHLEALQSCIWEAWSAPRYSVELDRVVSKTSSGNDDS